MKCLLTQHNRGRCYIISMKQVSSKHCIFKLCKWNVDPLCVCLIWMNSDCREKNSFKSTHQNSGEQMRRSRWKKKSQLARYASLFLRLTSSVYEWVGERDFIWVGSEYWDNFCLQQYGMPRTVEGFTDLRSNDFLALRADIRDFLMFR